MVVTHTLKITKQQDKKLKKSVKRKKTLELVKEVVFWVTLVTIWRNEEKSGGGRVDYKKLELCMKSNPWSLENCQSVSITT